MTETTTPTLAFRYSYLDWRTGEYFECDISVKMWRDQYDSIPPLHIVARWNHESILKDESITYALV